MKPIIYQLFVRLFGNKTENVRLNGTKKENGCGKFDDISTVALDSLRSFGISHVWYTGILEHAVATDYSEFGIEPDFPEIVKGRAGSPYAIKDYYDVDPDLANNVPGRMKEFEKLVDRTHAAGMKVIIDFVPNHLARVYKSDMKPAAEIDDFGATDKTAVAFLSENDFYYLPGQQLRLPDDILEKGIMNEYRKTSRAYIESPARATGNDCFSASPGSGDWYETVKLNYGIDYFTDRKLQITGIPPLWNKMRSVILYWAGKNIDGFRADMAEMVPVEFWEWLIRSVKKEFPDLVFIAEIYKPDLYRTFIERCGFDYLYDKMDFYDGVRNVVEQKSGTGVITRCWKKTGDLERFMLRFMENHDEQRIASEYFAGEPWKGIPAMVLAATMNNGPVMIYFGQESGEPAKGESGFSGDDGRTTIFDYWNVPCHQKWMNNGRFDGNALPSGLSLLRYEYSKLLRLVNEYTVFSNGAFYDLMWVNQETFSHSKGKIYSYLRYNEEWVSLIIINFGNCLLGDSRVLIPEDAFMAIKSGKKAFEGKFNAGKRLDFSPEGGTEAMYDKDHGYVKMDLPPLSSTVFLCKL